MENETNEYLQEQNENDNSENEIQNNDVVYENIVNDNDEYENTENQEQINETIEENIVLENTTIQETTENVTESYSDEKLDLIHQDLGIICSFLIAFVLVILLHYSYKFFDMFFKF